MKWFRIWSNSFCCGCCCCFNMYVIVGVRGKQSETLSSNKMHFKQASKWDFWSQNNLQRIKINYLYECSKVKMDYSQNPWFIITALQETTFLSFFFKCAKLKQSFKICHKIKHWLINKIESDYTTDLKLLYFTNSDYMCSSSTNNIDYVS